ncbi:class I SAM-dependent methyltransferase [Terribacillus halophilus]|jgi:ubiquinone/menaquinone biosynthesis C-methylase UbiE|uniref:class I SAM-dependent methyltransferase n=1 Tax=Terribacillus halophilus TaxID=361279 RepID=UPI000985A1E0|nr:methyltransferase domain-containing protein [Terribacillus halophilus]
MANKTTDVSAAEVVELLEIDGGEKVIVFGAGNGDLVIPIAHKTKDRVTALEKDESLLDKLALRAEEETLTNIDRMPSGLGRLNFPDSAFQRGLAAFVLDSTDDIELAAKEIYRVTIEKGIFLALGYSKDHSVDLVADKLQGAGFEVTKGQLHEELYYVKAYKA